jgi:hypothetical protein
LRDSRFFEAIDKVFGINGRLPDEFEKVTSRLGRHLHETREKTGIDPFGHTSRLWMRQKDAA